MLSAGTNDFILNYYDIPTRRQQFNNISAYQDFLLTALQNYIKGTLPGSRIVYADVYETVIDMVNNPQKYGFTETNRGCCGTGFVEVAGLCNSITPTCGSDSQFLFWDCIHPSEATYQNLAKYIESKILSYDITG
ncbi:hypothetical protein EZV62_003059 [Acer yangbiense]|uniref:SGNH hydrolase-type esterase domain-containing protein n=1 Tax=Acer yangbiense TaxID=1000413 RepID=A0A5C7IZ16_9ROSI|nr:hypothetical protein EZV62_003059 [Acer yangbiense]